MSRDPEVGNPEDPLSLHRHLYASGDPGVSRLGAGRLPLPLAAF
jgi:hypothetical protein